MNSSFMNYNAILNAFFVQSDCLSILSCTSRFDGRAVGIMPMKTCGIIFLHQRGQYAFLTLSGLNLPLSSSSTTSRELLSRNSRLVVDEDDLKWVEK